MTELKFYSAKEVQELLHIGRDKTYKLMSLDTFPSIRLGRTFIVGKEALINWLEENERRSVEL